MFYIHSVIERVRTGDHYVRQRDISDALGITEVTVRNTYKVIVKQFPAFTESLNIHFSGRWSTRQKVKRT